MIEFDAMLMAIKTKIITFVSGDVEFQQAVTKKLIFSVFAMNFLMYGVGYAPTIGRIMAISRQPFSKQDTEDFLVNSPLIPILLSPLKLNSHHVFALSCAVVSVTFITGSIFVCRKYCGSASARIVCLCFALSPVFATSSSWIGMYDPITLSMAIIWISVPASTFTILAGVVLGFNHVEQGFTLFLIVTVGHYYGLRISTEKEKSAPRQPTTSLVLQRGGGLLVGYLLLRAYHGRTGTPISRYGYIDNAGLGRYVGNFLQHSFFIPLSGLGCLIIPVVLASLKASGRQRIGYALSSLIAVSITLLTLDSTRVMAVLIFPVAVWAMASLATNLSGFVVQRKFLIVFIFLALAWPRIVIWDGRVSLGSWEIMFR